MSVYRTPGETYPAPQRRVPLCLDEKELMAVVYKAWNANFQWAGGVFSDPERGVLAATRAIIDCIEKSRHLLALDDLFEQAHNITAGHNRTCPHDAMAADNPGETVMCTCGYIRFRGAMHTIATLRGGKP